MKSKIKLLVCGLLVSLFLVGCGPSTEEIGDTVRASMQQKFDTDPRLSKHHLFVVEVQVIEQGDNHYKGMASVSSDGETHQVPIDVTSDGAGVMWEAKPGALIFLFQKELQKLQESFQ